jgi:hypothetical protein
VEAAPLGLVPVSFGARGMERIYFTQLRRNDKTVPLRNVYAAKVKFNGLRKLAISEKRGSCGCVIINSAFN